MTFHPHRYKPKNAKPQPFTRMPTLGDLARGSGGWPAGYPPGTAKKLSKRYLRSKKGGSKSSGIRNGVVLNEGTGGQYSMFNMKGHKSYLPKHVEDALAPQVIQTNGASQLKSVIGKQNFVVVMELNSPGVATTFTGDKISNVLYQKAVGDLTMNNIYLSNVYISIYDIVARKDVGASAISFPDGAWQQGATDESATAGVDYVGSSPWQSEVFNQFYEVKQVTNVVLGAGGTHVHKVRLRPNRLVNASYAQYTPYGMRGLTYYTMVLIHGQADNDTVNQAQVTIGVGGLNMVQATEHTLKLIQKQTPTISVTNNLLTSYTTAEQVINIGGSSIAAQAEG